MKAKNDRTCPICEKKRTSWSTVWPKMCSGCERYNVEENVDKPKELTFTDAAAFFGFQANNIEAHRE